MNGRMLTVAAAVLVGCGALAAEAVPPESVYDTTVYADEALVNVRVRNHRWPDCYSLETAIRDIFRIEGVNDTEDATEAKAMALWKWLLTLMSESGGRIFEGNPTGKWVRCHGDRDTQQIEIRRGDKLLLVYGVHECGGLSRTMAHLWRAAGFLAYQEPSSGHSVASLRYPDKDGVWRMHSFNPQGRSYYWNPRDNRVGTRRRPVLRGVEYKRLLPPFEHTQRTSLRLGETVTRRWSNDGYIQMTKRMDYWKKRPKDKQLAAHCVAGQEDQVLTAVTDPKTFGRQLFPGSDNVACSPAEKGSDPLTSGGLTPFPRTARLHPEKAGTTAAFIYRLASPAVAIESTIAATLRKGAESDVCRLAFSNNMGKTWHTVFDKTTVGAETVTVNVGRERYWKPEPSITSHYTFLVKAEFRTDGDPRHVGMDDLTVTVHRQFNMRAQPNLMPGENVLKITADRMAPGYALRFRLDYEVNGKPMTVTRVVNTFPHSLRVNVTGLPKEALKTEHYLANWGGKYTFNLPTHPLRMRSMRFELVPAASAKPDASDLVPAEAEAFFRKACPSPYISNRRMADKKKIPEYESEVSGFFPQLPRTKDQPTEPLAYYNWLVTRIGLSDAPLRPLPEGADPVAWCIKRLPRAHGGHTLGICNVLAHFRDRRAIPALLAKWDQAPKYGPGDRYIPDALAAIGDASVVPALTKRAKDLRIDYRIHIAHALGILGGDEAVRTLTDLAEHDPNISVRGEAKRALAAMPRKP